MLRVRVLDQPGQEIFLTDAHASPGRHKAVILKYIIARRQGDKLASQFVSVIEPYRQSPFIQKVERLDANTIAITTVAGERDRIEYRADHRVAVTRFDDAGHEKARFVAPYPTAAGKVTSVDAQRGRVGVRMNDPAADVDSLVGRVALFRNPQHCTAHTIAAARRSGDEVILEFTDDIFVGCAKVDAISGNAIQTSTPLPLAPIYRGCMLAGARFQPMARVAQIGNGKITLAAPLGSQDRPAPGDDVWLINVGPGDTFELPALVESSE
jgi:hypothetical protein